MVKYPGLSDFAGLFLFPGLAAILPWRFCFRVFHHLAGMDFLYRAETEAALAGVACIAPPEDKAAWSKASRLVWLVDHADLYLSRFRSDAWLHRHVTVTGNWPADDNFIAITFHWGAGMWALRHMRAQGRKVSVLVRGIERASFSGALLRYAYGKLRLLVTAQAGGDRLTMAGSKSLYDMKHKLKEGSCIVGLLDVPVDSPRNALATQFLGREAYFPRGLLFLAVNSGVPVVLYSMGVDRKTGHRHLAISDPLTARSEQALLDTLASRLTELVAQDSPAWHHWGGVQSFFQKGFSKTTDAS